MRVFTKNTIRETKAFLRRTQQKTALKKLLDSNVLLRSYAQAYVTVPETVRFLLHNLVDLNMTDFPNIHVWSKLLVRHVFRRMLNRNIRNAEFAAHALDSGYKLHKRYFEFLDSATGHKIMADMLSRSIDALSWAIRTLWIPGIITDVMFEQIASEANSNGHTRFNIAASGTGILETILGNEFCHAFAEPVWLGISSDSEVPMSELNKCVREVLSKGSYELDDLSGCSSDCPILIVATRDSLAGMHHETVIAMISAPMTCITPSHFDVISYYGLQHPVPISPVQTLSCQDLLAYITIQKLKALLHDRADIRLSADFCQAVMSSFVPDPKNDITIWSNQLLTNP